MGVIIPKLRQSAKGQECTLNVVGVCNYDRDTTVLAHLRNPNKGMGNKGDDWHAVFACSACHDALDNRRLGDSEASYVLAAIQQTQRIWYDNGEMKFNEPRQIKAKTSSKILARKPMTVQP